MSTETACASVKYHGTVSPHLGALDQSQISELARIANLMADNFSGACHSVTLTNDVQDGNSYAHITDGLTRQPRFVYHLCYVTI